MLGHQSKIGVQHTRLTGTLTKVFNSFKGEKKPQQYSMFTNNSISYLHIHPC